MNDLTVAKSKLPAHLKNKAVSENAFGAAVSLGGFPVISIKGKVFHVQRGDERELISIPDDPDEPARSLELVIVGINNAKSKVFYEKGYTEGSTDAPTCYSNDGVAPAIDAEEKQAKKCAACPHNQWGSRITESGGKGKLCQDSMRLAVCPSGQLNDPMLLRVPATSLKTLGNYGTTLAKRAVAPEYVITKVGFDFDVSHPALTFKATKFVDEDQLAQIEECKAEEAETIGLILGTITAPMADTETVADAPVGNSNSSDDEDDDDDLFDDEEEVVEEKPKPKAKAKAKPKAKPKAKKEEPKEEALDFDDVDEALDSLDFDD